MISRYVQKLYPSLLLLLLASGISLATKGATNDPIAEKRIGVAMRMIGHEVLTCLGDEHSRVLPIEQSAREEEFTTYRIPFGFQFEVDPSDIIVIIEQVMSKANITSDYLVQLEQCDTKAIVHSFEIRNAYPDIIPCSGRILPQNCYSLLITLFEGYQPLTDIPPTKNLSSNSPLGPGASRPSPFSKVTFCVVPLLIIIGFTGYFIKRKKATDLPPHVVLIGAYQWDQKNMTLSFEDDSTPLSHKEAALLQALHDNANRPMERNTLLQQVWGDEGDYIGRTLDVFISKLRKKLEADSTIKIVNIRGVGYKLVVD